MKKIVLTGGGSAGHVTSNIALLPALKAAGYDISYIGSYDGIEKRLIEDYGIPYYGVSTGKFRRYLDPKNFSDPFRVIKGFSEARKLLKKIKPDIIFSKGGFVSVPVVKAAASLKIPCVIHESDLTPGLANRLCIPSATKVCCNFPETIQYIKSNKAVVTGSPIRKELREGNADAAYKLCGFEKDKPVVLVIGGSLGAMAVNQIVRDALSRLLEDFQVVHICGKDKMDNLLINTPGYKQFEYVKSELKDIFAMADVVISRAGANAICELLALRKPNLLVPLPSKASRGDQLLNARSFEAQGFSMVVYEEELDEDILVDRIHELYFQRDTYIETMSKSGMHDSITTIMGILEDLVHERKRK